MRNSKSNISDINFITTYIKYNKQISHFSLNKSVPSVILADATWYGSLRGGVTFGGGDDTRFMDGGSRWGIKGSNELAEGLSANYRFEHKLSTANASLANSEDGSASNGRLAYVGLSGGFGTLSLGQIWSASFNSTGAITDNTLLWGNSHTSYRVGNALSYSNSVGNASVQIDAIMDSSRDTGGAVDQVEFGMTIGLGDIGKLAVAYVESKDTNMKTAVHVTGDSGRRQIDAVAPIYLIPDPDDDDETIETHKMIEVNVHKDNSDSISDALFDANGKISDSADVTRFQNGIIKSDGGMGYYFDNSANNDSTDVRCTETPIATRPANYEEICTTVTVYVKVMETYTTAEGTGAADNVDVVNPSTTETYYLVDEDDVMMKDGTGIPAQTAKPYVPHSTTKMDDIKPGFKGTHVAVEFGLGAVTAWAGYSRIENNGGGFKTKIEEKDDNVHSGTGGIINRTAVNVASETKVTHAGVRGSLGDAGMNYLLAYRAVDDAGDKTSPYVINLNKSLGDGATAFVEHANDDDGKSGRTWVGLKVDF